MNWVGKAALLIVLLLCAVPETKAGARVLVFDATTTVHTPVFIRIQTRGAVFAAGGSKAEIRVDDWKELENRLKRLR